MGGQSPGARSRNHRNRPEHSGPPPRESAAASTRATSMIDHLREERLGVGGAAKRRFDFGAQRIHRFLRDEDVRGGHEVHGAALFACGEDTFHAVPLWRSPGDEVSAGRRFALRRLAAADARTSQLMLVIAGRELGRLVLLQDGALIELMDADQEIENRHLCPTCNERVQDDFQVCPSCLTKLRRQCHFCNHLLAPEWSLCPYCGR